MKLFGSLLVALSANALVALAAVRQQTTVVFVDNNNSQPVVGNNANICNTEPVVRVVTVEETQYITPSASSVPVTVTLTSMSPVVSESVVTVPLVPAQTPVANTTRSPSASPSREETTTVIIA